MASRALLVSAALVIGLLVGLGATYVATSAQVSSLQKSLSDANASNMMLHEEIQNATLSIVLRAQPGQTFQSGLVILSAVGGGHYVISLHAEGLKPASAGGYIVEGVTRGATMQMVPISGNATASEFVTGTTGVGNYWTVVMQNPSSSFDAIDLLYLPNMDMTHATLVASAQIG